jgi:hypothetical protein
MLNVALVGLLAGTLAVGGGDSKNPQTGDKPAPAPAVPGILITQSVDAPTPLTIQDTYAFGRTSGETPLRFWAHYAQGEAEGIWNTDGETEEVQIAFTDGDLVTRRVGIGAELGLPVGLFGFGIAAGAQLNLAQNQFQVGAEQGANPGAPVGTPAGGFITDDLESDFGLQNVKVYGIARAGAIGLHGGYIFDLGSDREFAANGLPTSLSNSDGRDAFFFGADFDYPSERFRLFGGVDYYKLHAGGTNNPNTTEDETLRSGDDILNSLFGVGVKLSVFEIGAALQIQARYSQPLVGDIGTATGIGGSAATIAPYLRISPPQIPASIFIKGAVQDEYTEYGFRLGGSNSPKPSMGFTAGLTFGFQ